MRFGRSCPLASCWTGALPFDVGGPQRKRKAPGGTGAFLPGCGPCSSQSAEHLAGGEGRRALVRAGPVC